MSRRAVGSLLAVLVLALIAAPTAGAVLITERVDLDTYVRSDFPATAFDTAGNLDGDSFTDNTLLYIDGSPIRRSLLKFTNVPASLNGVTAATLRIYVQFNTTQGYDVRAASCDWTGATTYNTAPAQGAIVGSKPSDPTGWNDITLSSATYGTIAAGGTICFEVSKAGVDWGYFQGLENAGTNEAQLVFNQADAPPPPPVGEPNADGDALVDDEDQCPTVAASTITGCATGTIRYISPTGTDSGACTLTAPCRSWTFADNLVTSPGDAIVARGGTYTNQGGSWGGANGTSAARVAFRNYPGETPVFDGSGCDCSFMGFTARDYTLIKGLSIQNYTFHGIWMGYSGSGTNYSSFNIVRGLTITHVGYPGAQRFEHPLYLSYGNTDLIVENNLIRDTPGALIHGYHGPGIQRAEIRNNILDTGYWGMLFRDGARDIHIYNNTVRNITGEGCIEVTTGGQGETGDTGSYNPVVRNNIVANCAQGIASSGATNPTIDHNTCFNVGLNPGTLGCGANALTSDPMFVGATDYHLQTGSPSRDSGYSGAGIPSADRDGTARPQGAGVDRGAYEQG